MLAPETARDSEGQHSAPLVAVLDASGGFLQHAPPSEGSLALAASWPQTLLALMKFPRGRRDPIRGVKSASSEHFNPYPARATVDFNALLI